MHSSSTVLLWLWLQACTGRHLLLSNRSGVRLELGDAEGALQDASAAAACAPPDFTTAVIRQACFALAGSVLPDEICQGLCC
jgi:hypothetical protein